jgi:Dynamin family
MRLTDVRKALEQIRYELSEVKHLAVSIGEASLVDRTERVLDSLCDPTFRVLVVGEFKSGKSTFTRALQDQPLPPECAWAGNGIEVVDTAGIGATNPERELTALSLLSTADAVVFLTPANAALSESELQFLTEHLVPRDRGKLFVVVNFADQIEKQRDRQKLQTRIARKVAPITGKSEAPLISAALARDAIESGNDAALKASGLPELRRKLEKFLVRDCAGPEITRYHRITQILRDDLERALRQRLALAGLAEPEIGDARRRIKELISLATAEGHLLERDATERFKKLESTIYCVSMEPGVGQLPTLQGVLRRGLKNLHQDLAARINTLDAQLHRSLTWADESEGSEAGESDEADLDFPSLVAMRGRAPLPSPNRNGHPHSAYPRLSTLLLGPQAIWASDKSGSPLRVIRSVESRTLDRVREVIGGKITELESRLTDLTIPRGTPAAAERSRLTGSLREMKGEAVAVG